MKDMIKNSQILESDPVYVAEQLHNIIKIMVNRMSFETRRRSYDNVASRIQDFNTVEIANKKSPGGASIGVSLGLIKNVLNGRDPYFINIVLSELATRL